MAKKTNKTVIKWAAGSRWKTEAEKAHQVIEELRAKCNGDVLPEKLVAASKPRSAVLHKEFEWNDERAGAQWRTEQARRMIRSIIVIREEAPDISSRKYEYVSVSKADSPTEKARNVYRTTEDILKNPATREQLISRFIREAQDMRRRYAQLSELALLWTAMDEVLDSLGKREVG